MAFTLKWLKENYTLSRFSLNTEFELSECEKRTRVVRNKLILKTQTPVANA